MTELLPEDKAELLKRLHADGYSAECVRLLGHALVVFMHEPIHQTDGTRAVRPEHVHVEKSDENWQWLTQCVQNDVGATRSPHNWEDRINGDWWVKAYERAKERAAA